MDFKKAFIAVSVAFLTVIVDMVLNTAYIFPVIVIIFLTYFLMRFFEESRAANEGKNKPSFSVKDIPECNVKFFKSIIKKKLQDFEKNRFLVSFLEKKINQLKEKQVDYVKISLDELADYYNLKEPIKGYVFAKKGFFEKELKDFFAFLDNEGIKYSLNLGVERDFSCQGSVPVLVEVTFPHLSLSDRQIEIILVGDKYTGRVKVVTHLFRLRKVVEEAGGFFVVVREEGTKAFFGFSGLEY